MADEIGPDGGGSLRRSTGPLGNQSDRPYLRAMVRNPETVFLYWDFDREQAPGGSESEDARWVLQIENFSTGETRIVDLDPDTHSYYAEVSPGCTHQFAIGTLTEGSFSPVCNSKEIEVPANQISRDLSARKAETLFATGDASSSHSGSFAGSSDVTRRKSSRSFWPQSDKGQKS